MEKINKTLIVLILLIGVVIGWCRPVWVEDTAGWEAIPNRLWDGKWILIITTLASIAVVFFGKPLFQGLRKGQALLMGIFVSIAIFFRWFRKRWKPPKGKIQGIRGGFEKPLGALPSLSGSSEQNSSEGAKNNESGIEKKSEDPEKKDIPASPAAISNPGRENQTGSPGKSSNGTIPWWNKIPGWIIRLLITVLLSAGAMIGIYFVWGENWWVWFCMVACLGFIFCVLNYQGAFGLRKNQFIPSSFADFSLKEPSGILVTVGVVLILVSFLSFLISWLIILVRPFFSSWWPIMGLVSISPFLVVLIIKQTKKNLSLREKKKLKTVKWIVGILGGMIILGFYYQFFFLPNPRSTNLFGKSTGNKQEILSKFRGDSILVEKNQLQSWIEKDTLIRNQRLRAVTIDYDSVVFLLGQLQVNNDRKHSDNKQLQQEIVLLRSRIDTLLRDDSTNKIALFQKNEAIKQMKSQAKTLESQFDFAGKNADSVIKKADSLATDLFKTKDSLRKEQQNRQSLERQFAAEQKKKEAGSEQDWLVISIFIMLFTLSLIFFYRIWKKRKQGEKVEWKLAVLTSVFLIFLLASTVGITYVVTSKKAVPAEEKDLKRQKELLDKQWQDSMRVVKQEFAKTLADTVEKVKKEIPRTSSTVAVVDTAAINSLKKQIISLRNLVDTQRDTIVNLRSDTSKPRKREVQKSHADTTIIAKTDRSKRKSKKVVTTKKRDQIRITSIAEPDCCVVSDRKNRER